MEPQISLEPGKDIFTLRELLNKAAAHKGLVIPANFSEAYSEPIKEYILDQGTLKILEANGIKRQPRPDAHDIFTLVDENPQKVVPGWAASNYWNFKSVDGSGKNFDPRIQICFGFKVSMRERGVVCTPSSHGTFLSPCDPLPNFRMFQALVKSDPKPPKVAKEMALSNGWITIFWADLGLGGIRKLSDLFSEFASNETVRDLGRDGIFKPNPFPRHQEADAEVFIAEPAQPNVFKMWKEQLDNYREKLVA